MARYIVGADIGGGTVKFGLFDAAGELRKKWAIATPLENGGSEILPAAAASILDTLREIGIEKSDVIGVGAGSPGLVTAEGVVRVAANLGWENVNIPEILGGLLGLPVKAANDANAAALGEAWQGGGKGLRHMVLLTLGTGVGGGIVSDGKLLVGHSGAAGEIGHVVIEPGETTPCACGRCGCLEQYASATGLLRLAKEHLINTDAESVLRSADPLTAKAVLDGAREGDRVALEIAERFADYLGRGVGMLAMTLDPEAFVIGGGLSGAGEMLLDLIRPAYERYVMDICKARVFRLATLGADAGIYGAAALFAMEGRA